MTERAPRKTLRDALRDRDEQDATGYMRAVVIAASKATEPYTVRVRLADGTETDPLMYAGWYDPTVGDVVNILTHGSALWVLGADAPCNVVAPPPVRLVPAPPDPPPVIEATPRTVSVAPVDMAYWSPWGWKTDDLAQGGAHGLRSLWLYGDGIAAARGTGTIVAGAVYMRRRETEHGVGGAAHVRLGTHPHATRPAGDPGPLTAVSAQAQLARGHDATVPLSQAQIDTLNGGALGVGLDGPATGYRSVDYLRVSTGVPSGQLVLTVVG